ncbi:heterokaryon incompatibility protein-domain-containing protein [Dactylonectria macrodidyma]|uniref:Heterokaryon incompatibility protein-domain-containing protein n=1 Tax=Dactylonectria macrodidyma TaxID=307937 RepID=A0A9P9J3G3_9HYPO|nr:heterokaryon incompatibility protein-domain-containing protein [Dactylonectria macrodidyma]
MRLLNARTLCLESFVGQAPRYAILSHRWGDAELLFQDAARDGWQHRISSPGATKVARACARAVEDKLDYIWIDTCCIDKGSSAELSEAINSMFLWYHEAVVCYAYLADVDKDDRYGFALSQWFKRGWTLQELIAPEVVAFYDRNWEYMGDRNSMARTISEITNIHEPVLARKQPIASSAYDLIQWQRHHSRDYRLRSILSSYSVAARLSWAAGRKTTREEDTAYSLLGLFDVNMPLLYGEGDKAFQRLLHEIIQYTGDPSVLVSWGAGAPLRQNPSHYEYSGSVRWLEAQGSASSRVSITNPRTLAIEALHCPCVVYAAGDIVIKGHFFVAIVDCIFDGSQSRIGIVLQKRGLGKVFEQYYELPFIQLEPHPQGKVVGSMSSLTTARVSFKEEDAQFGRLQVALTEAYPAARGNPKLFVTPLVQPPTLHYTLGSSELVSDDSHIVDNDVGVFVVENELSRGFFLIWGYGQPGEDGGIESENRSESAEHIKPWCRVLPWKGAMPGASRTEVHLQGEPDIFVLDRDPVELFSARETFVEMIDRFRTKRSDGRLVDLGDVVVRVTFRPNTFLGYTEYSLVVEIEPARTRRREPVRAPMGYPWKRKRAWWERFSPPLLMISAKKKATKWC